MQGGGINRLKLPTEFTFYTSLQSKNPMCILIFIEPVAVYRERKKTRITTAEVYQKEQKFAMFLPILFISIRFFPFFVRYGTDSYF